MCELLNLDVNRPNLNFTAAEIRKAYQKRALRFHPDRQPHLSPKIPVEICNVLMNDINRAREHLLKGEDNIIGKGLLDKANQIPASDWSEVVISVLHGIQMGSSTMGSFVPWISRFSNTIFMWALMSTYSDNQLNFRFVNSVVSLIAPFRPFLEQINGEILIAVLQKIKGILDTTQEADLEKALTSNELLQQIKAILPADLNIDDSKLAKISKALKEAHAEVKNMLTDEFIAHVAHISQFWPHFLATVPSWLHILGVNFISLLFTATSLPKFFNAFLVINDVIIQQKGLLAFYLTIIPSSLLAITLLPINLLVQMSYQLTFILVPAVVKAIYYSLNLISSLLGMLLLLNPYGNQEVFKSTMKLLESTLYLCISLPINLVLELFDSLGFIITNMSLLSSTQNDFNQFFDSLFAHAADNEQTKRPETDGVADESQELPTSEEKESNSAGFFPTQPLHNAEDKWLDHLFEIIESDNNPCVIPQAAGF